MTSPLIPALTGRQLTVDVALKQPTVIRNQIAKLADDQILLPKFFRQFGQQVQGGGMLSRMNADSPSTACPPTLAKVTVVAMEVCGDIDCDRDTKPCTRASGWCVVTIGTSKYSVASMLSPGTPILLM